MYTELTTKRIESFALAEGMFVSKLDIPWSETSYPIEGFIIEQQDQIIELSALCQYVYIDLRLSKHIPFTGHIKLDLQSKSKLAPQHKLDDADANAQRAKKKTRLQNFRFTQYDVKTKFQREIITARLVYTDASARLSEIIEQKSNLSGENLHSLKAIAARMVKSALNNPDALNWISKINNSYRYLYQQVLSTTVTGVIFARSLGLEQRKIEFLTLSLLLRAIGISELKKSELVKYVPDNTSKDFEEHLSLTLNAISEFRSIPSSVVNTIENHCENYDGSGYPSGKIGNRIPIMAQIVRLVTYYEDLVNPLVKQRAISAAKAMSFINARREHFFDTELVYEFIKAIGIYPTGSFVELSDSSLGMVVEQKEQKRLRAKVAVLVHSNGVNLSSPIIVDLSEQKNKDLSINQSITSHKIKAEQVLKCANFFQKKTKVAGFAFFALVTQ